MKLISYIFNLFNQLHVSTEATSLLLFVSFFCFCYFNLTVIFAKEKRNIRNICSFLISFSTSTLLYFLIGALYQPVGFVSIIFGILEVLTFVLKHLIYFVNAIITGNENLTFVPLTVTCINLLLVVSSLSYLETNLDLMIEVLACKIKETFNYLRSACLLFLVHSFRSTKLKSISKEFAYANTIKDKVVFNC